MRVKLTVKTVILEHSSARTDHMQLLFRCCKKNITLVGNIIFCFVDSPKSETLLCIRDARPILGMID